MCKSSLLSRKSRRKAHISKLRHHLVYMDFSAFLILLYLSTACIWSTVSVPVKSIGQEWVRFPVSSIPLVDRPNLDEYSHVNLTEGLDMYWKERTVNNATFSFIFEPLRHNLTNGVLSVGMGEEPNAISYLLIQFDIRKRHVDVDLIAHPFKFFEFADVAYVSIHGPTFTVKINASPRSENWKQNILWYWESKTYKAEPRPVLRKRQEAGTSKTISKNEALVDQFFIHGIIMFIAWQVILPIGMSIVLVRPTNYIAHIVVQVFAFMGAVYSFGHVYNLVGPNFVTTHSILGVVLGSFFGLQIVFGLGKSWTKRSSASSILKPKSRLYFSLFLRFAHRIIGFLLFYGSLLQCVLGLEKLYPLESRTNRPFWYAMIVNAIFWTCMFTFLVLNRVYGKIDLESRSFAVEREEKTMPQKVEILNEPLRELMGKTSTTRPVSARNIAKEDVSQIDPQPVSSKKLKTIDWSSINLMVEKGQCIVTLNNKVYDVTRFVQTHPGGRAVLSAVAGTDITDSIFPLTATETIESLDSPSPLEKISTLAALRTLEDKSIASEASNSRIHSPKALEILQRYLIAELDTKEDDTSVQYKRYVITKKKLITKETETRKVYEIRFCIVASEETANLEAQRTFKPGQCVEIQLKLSDNYVTRYYTPIRGNMQCFDVIVRINSRNGEFSSVFGSLAVADRQFKIRGPLGKPIFDKSVTQVKPSIHFLNFSMNDGTDQFLPDRLYFVCSGTGITPFLSIMYNFIALPGSKKSVCYFYPQSPCLT